MPPADQVFYDRFIRRVNWMIVGLGVAGSAILALSKGARVGLAFLIGATGSYVSFWGWQRVAEALTPSSKKPRSYGFILRIVVLFVLAYAIIRFLGLSFAAVVSGLLVSAAAVLLELIFELIYART